MKNSSIGPMRIEINNKYNKRIWEEDFKQLRFDVLRFLRDILIAFVNNPGLFLYPVWVRENVPREFSFWTKSLKTFFKDLWYIARDVFWEFVLYGFGGV